MEELNTRVILTQSVENDDLPEKVVALLIEKGLTISCAESCTGGMLSARLISVSGVSAVYNCGYITYSNQSKHEILNVKSATLEKYGAVSSQTAQEMARGASLKAKSDVAVSITGIAGPDGGTEEKPVGLVYIACNVKGNITVQKYNFKGNRAEVRESATLEALILLKNCLLDSHCIS